MSGLFYSANCKEVNSWGYFNINYYFFVLAKLIGAIGWSWWLVLLPLIIKVVLCIFIVIVAFIAAVIEDQVKK